ncbi:MAG TPA: CbtA family protein [Roseiflexaceae bacterium]
MLPALTAGLAAGMVAAILQQLFLVPLILQAEVLEEAGHAHAAASGIERTLYSVLFTCLGACGFALLLAGCFALRRDVNWRTGLLWGLAGFASFSLAPALGLPPELPGAHAAGLVARQAWWIATAIATATGLACVALPKSIPLKLLGVVLVALPHLIGAPQPVHADSELPADVVRVFAIGSLTVSAVMWLILGILTPALMRRYPARID